MKKIIIITAIAISLFLPVILSAQPHPNGGNNPVTNGNKPVGETNGAPIGSGTELLVMFSAVYVVWKLLSSKKSILNLET